MNLLTAKAHVAHAIGAAPSVAPGQTVDERTIEVINHAGQQLYTRPWRWREASAELDLIAGMSYISPPVSMRFDRGGEFVSMNRIEDGGEVELTTPAEMDQRHDGTTTAPSGGSTTHVSLPWEGGAQAIRIYPLPGQTTPRALRMRYRKEYVPRTIVMADEVAFDFPSYVDPVFTAYLRAFAQGYEDDGMPARLAEIDAGPLLQTALMKDGLASRDVGRLRPQRGRTFR